MPDLRKLNGDFFKSYLTVLRYFRCTGINILDETNMLIFKFKYIHVITFTIFFLMSLCHWRFLIEKLLSGSDFLELSVDLSVCYNALEGAILFLYLCINKSRIQKFVFKLEKQWRDDSILLPHVVICKHKQIHDFDRRNNVICKSIELYSYFYMGYPLLVTLVQRYIFMEETDYTTPLGYTMPFEFKNNTPIFLFIYLLDYTAMIILSMLINCSIFLLTVTVNQLKILFVLLQEDFKEVIESKDKDINIKLKQTIQRHSILTELFKEIGPAWGAVYAIHVFFLMFTVCFYAIAAKINKRFEDLKNLMISFLTAGNTFYCSLYGELLAESAQDVASAIYESSWEDLSVENKKTLLFTMLRSQQRFFIKSTTFTQMSLATFINIMKMAWSFISLVTAVYEK